MRELYFLSNYFQAHRSTRGVLSPPIEVLTAQGYDMQFGTNVLGPYFFTKYVFPMDRLKLTKYSLPMQITSSTYGDDCSLTSNF